MDKWEIAFNQADSRWKGASTLEFILGSGIGNTIPKTIMDEILREDFEKYLSNLNLFLFYGLKSPATNAARVALLYAKELDREKEVKSKIKEMESRYKPSI